MDVVDPKEEKLTRYKKHNAVIKEQTTFDSTKRTKPTSKTKLHCSSIAIAKKVPAETRKKKKLKPRKRLGSLKSNKQKQRRRNCRRK